MSGHFSSGKNTSNLRNGQSPGAGGGADMLLRRLIAAAMRQLCFFLGFRGTRKAFCMLRKASGFSASQQSCFMENWPQRQMQD
jgi:hypothetical protein